MSREQMRLAIVDPPYFGRAATWYGGRMRKAQIGKRHGGQSKSSDLGVHPADNHPEAYEFDNLETHRLLLAQICNEYDGWAVAMAHDNLKHYLSWAPVDARIGIWHKPNSLPSAARVMNVWEPVLYLIPKGRRSSIGAHSVQDLVRAQAPRNGFAGSKPAAWTRWVLDLLGYRDGDHVDDLFPGSGLVQLEINQGVIL